LVLGTRLRCAAFGALAALAITLSDESARAEEREPVLAMSVAVAAVDANGERVVDDAWVEAEWAAVDRLYAGIGIRFERRWAEPLPETSARLETKEDRDALGEHVVDGAINVFFVKALLDIDEIGRIRMGVCWRTPARKRFVAVASNAKPTVLAHELGHFLGNGHSKVTDNVMSYDRTGGPVFFDATQKKTMRATALQLLRDGIVKPGQP
jgi:predicted outer membrane lipoprotein